MKRCGRCGKPLSDGFAVVEVACDHCGRLLCAECVYPGEDLADPTATLCKLCGVLRRARMAVR